MEEFKNDPIDTTNLPRYEEIIFRKLEQRYLFVILINLAIFGLILGMAYIGIYLSAPGFGPVAAGAGAGAAMLFAVVATASIISFYKRGFAFRDHDVLYRSGVLATNITIVPYNRIQHVALHEGPFPRLFGLTEVRVYTAGGGSSDIAVPGIRKEEAQAIKQLLMGKIQKPLS